MIFIVFHINMIKLFTFLIPVIVNQYILILTRDRRYQMDAFTFLIRLHTLNNSKKKRLEINNCIQSTITKGKIELQKLNQKL